MRTIICLIAMCIGLTSCFQEADPIYINQETTAFLKVIEEKLPSIKNQSQVEYNYDENWTLIDSTLSTSTDQTNTVIIANNDKKITLKLSNSVLRLDASSTCSKNTKNFIQQVDYMFFSMIREDSHKANYYNFGNGSIFISWNNAEPTLKVTMK